MTLQVQQRFTSVIAYLLKFDRTQTAFAGAKSIHVVEGGSGMDRHQLIPAILIGFLIMVHVERDL
jgi:hypothetical protein